MQVRSLVSPALLEALASAGLGDTIAIVDSTFPADRYNPFLLLEATFLPISSVALESGAGVVRLPGLPLVAVVREVLA